MPQNEELESILSFLGREDVRRIFARSAETAITRESIADIPLPAGLTLRQTEDLLGTVNRLHATYVPMPDAEGTRYWYTVTQEIMRLLRVIDRNCTTDSALSHSVGEREGKRLLIKSLLEEAIATSRMGGVDIEPGRARELLRMDHTPVNDAEQVVANAYGIFTELRELACEDITPDFIVGLYDRLTHKTHRAKFSADEVVGGPVVTMTRREVLMHLSAMASDVSTITSEHPAITATLLLWDTQYWQPFPEYNRIIGGMLFRLHAVKQQYPVLGILPIVSTNVARWQEPVSGYAGGSNLDVRRFAESENTHSVTQQLQVIQQSIESLWSEVTIIKERDQNMRSLLQLDPELNARQRSILGRALRMPHATFRIRYHQSTHNIAYSTARTDLMELEAKGYLVREQQGFAHVFVAAPGLAERIDPEGARAAAENELSEEGV